MNFDPLARMSKRTAIILVSFLFAIFAAELFFSIRQQSQTVDESVHIFSGYQYWKHRDFGANPEHPPLVKIMATLPLLELNLKPTEILTGPTKSVHTEKAIPFLYDNSVPGQTILSRARNICILFPLILAVLLFLCCLEVVFLPSSIFAVCTWPKAVEVSESQLRQRCWHGRWKEISWADVTSFKEKKSGSIIVYGRKNKIAFAAYHADREVFLEQLNRKAAFRTSKSSAKTGISAGN
jgi:hypothetical protein